MGKRIRYPKKKKIEEMKLKENEKEKEKEEKQEQPLHFVLDVHNSDGTSSSNF